MDFKLILLALGIALGSCADLKHTAEVITDNAENLWKGKHTLSVTFNMHRPYCGGAAPSPEQEMGFTEPIANQVYYIYKDERPKSVTKMVKVTTDEQGKFSIDLEEGVYSIIHGDKGLPLDEFIEKKKIIASYYNYSDNDCFEKWRTTPDFTINLVKTTDETVVISSRCFTGDNPCMDYIGPYPP